LELEKEKEKIRFEEEIYIKREEHKPLITTDLKKLWKKLIAKFHPDLVQNPTEKKKRDAVMKQINRAYEEGDYEQLLKIEKDHAATKETTIENLEEMLLNLMKEIEVQVKLAAELKKSEWYDWMIKIENAKKKNGDIFAVTEKRLLDDIVEKFNIIKFIKQQIQDKEAGVLII
jgi:oligoendopeptidase F